MPLPTLSRASLASPWTLAAILAAMLLVAVYLGFYSQPSGTGIAELYKPIKPRVVDHTRYFEEKGITRYEGSKTCLECHYDEAVGFFHSYHYQMASLNRGVNGGKRPLGGRLLLNDYCMAIFLDNGTRPLNWIGYVRLKRAPEGYEQLVGSFTGLTGCSMCHGVTMGLPPSWNMTREQLENIDCLACHVKPEVYLSGPIAIKEGYKNVTRDEQGRWRYEVKIPIDKIAKSIIDKPTAQNCLACHAFSGGGPGLKRPNITPDLMDPAKAKRFDVHFAKGLSCVDCHPGSGHGFPTNATDTWNRERGEARRCVDCHGEKPHRGITGWIVNRFHERVACQTCHIPFIAHGSYPTELYRDWSAATFLPEKHRWKFSLPDPETRDTSRWHLYGNLTPVYAWYNGSRIVYVFPEKAQPIPLEQARDKIGGTIEASEIKPVNGRLLGALYYVKPLGGRDDPNSKIYPFRVHAAIVPYSTKDRLPVPMKVGIAFATGNVTLAALVGAKEAGISWSPGDYVLLIRYMQVNHGVQPRDKALFCFDCHGPTVRRMPWPELGYGHYPEIAFTGISIAIAAVVVYAAYRIVRSRRS
ncbi:MAG: hypothetical protein GXO15_06750 [Crenarchaeota archaeon]|nr:hypothetical protein [Thermoproteota archaeon]